MSDLDLMFPSKYLAAADLDGKAVTVKIKSVTQEDLAFAGGKKEKRIVVRFANTRTDKMWLMNKTNAYSLGVLLWQSDTNSFINKSVTLVSDEDVIKGELTTCVRVSDSPDATPKGRAAFMRCWNDGDRKGNKMIERLKRVMAQIKKEGKGAPTPPPAPPTPPATPPPEKPAVSPHPEDNPPPPETGGGDFKY